MQNPISLFNEAFYLINSSTIENCNEDFYSLIHSDPNFNKNRRFSFKSNNDNNKKAIDLFAQFTALKPYCKFAYNYSGIAKVNIQDFQAAIDDFTKVLDIDPYFATAYHNRAHMRFLLKEYKEAIIDGSKAIYLNKNNGNYYEIRGSSKNQLKDFKGAIKDFTKCIKLKPNNFRVYRLRAFAYYELKNYEKAIEDFNTVYDNANGNFNAYLTRGKSFFKLKKYQNAIDDLEIVVAADPNVGWINSMLKEAKIKQIIVQQTLLESGMPSKKQLILNAITTMDRSLLELLLDDYKTYHDTTKDLFIEKMNSLFEEFKKQNDTELIPFKGKCKSNSCENKGCTGFSFVGNVSKSYSCLIFEETENNFKDIYHCYQFKTEKKIKGLTEKHSFDINDDDKASFIQTPDYLVKANGAINAFSEISATPPQLLDLEQLSYWLEKHTILYSEIGEYDIFQPIMKWTPFLSLYSDLKEIKDYLDSNYGLIQIAFNQYNTFETEQIKIDWVVTNETIFKLAPYYLQFSKCNDTYIEMTIDQKSKIHFCGKELLISYHFLTNYEITNRDLLKKYCIYTDEEFTEKFNDRAIDNIQEDLYRLNYHMQKRQELEKIGVKIPFNIIGSSI